MLGREAQEGEEFLAGFLQAVGDGAATHRRHGIIDPADLSDMMKPFAQLEAFVSRQNLGSRLNGGRLQGDAHHSAVFVEGRGRRESRNIVDRGSGCAISRHLFGPEPSCATAPPSRSREGAIKLKWSNDAPAQRVTIGMVMKSNSALPDDIGGVQVSPPPIHNEWLPEYIGRLASLNGYRGHQRRTFFRIAISRKLNIKPEYWGIEHAYRISVTKLVVLARNLRLSPDTLIHLIHMQLGDKRVPLPHICMPFCPLCLDERGYVEQIWAMGKTKVCPRHCIELPTHCIRCGAPIDVLREDTITCRCGSDLRSGVIYIPQHHKKLCYPGYLFNKIGQGNEHDCPSCKKAHPLWQKLSAYGAFTFAPFGYPRNEPSKLLRDEHLLPTERQNGFSPSTPAEAISSLRHGIRENSVWSPGRTAISTASQHFVR